MSSVTQFIKRATRKRPWLLILDDLQWADRSSLELLRYLGHHLPSMHLMIIGTYRDNELDRNHPLWETLRNLSRYPLRHYSSIGLDPDGSQPGLAYIWKQPAPASLKDKILPTYPGKSFLCGRGGQALVDDGLIILQGGDLLFPALEDVRTQICAEAVWRRIGALPQPGSPAFAPNGGRLGADLQV